MREIAYQVKKSHCSECKQKYGVDIIQNKKYTPTYIKILPECLVTSDRVLNALVSAALVPPLFLMFGAPLMYVEGGRETKVQIYIRLEDDDPLLCTIDSPKSNNINE